MSEPPDKKDDPQPEAEVVSIEDARKRAEGKQTEEAAPAAADPAANPLQPIMAAIARELAGLAGPDGQIKIDGNSPDAESQAKTQALLRGIGQGLGEVLAQALSKWAGGKVNLNFVTAPGEEKPQAIPATPIRAPEPPPGADDPTKKS
jgi:hypothetical protein